MSNKIGSVKVTLSYPGPGGSTVAASQSILASFMGSSSGQIDVPDATAGATAFSVPFGTVATGATMVLVVNKMGQDAILKVNGSLALNNIPDGGVALITAASLPAASKLTAVSLTTTDTVDGSETDRTIDYWVLGDPV